MATKIVTKNSSTASAVPTASDLVQGELAVNVADKKLFTEDNSGAIIELADGVKLAGIEASADVTDTANVTAAGAVMDSELTAIASVKALNQGVATTDSPAFAGLTVDTDTLAVDSTNNRVGIGTTSPEAKLHISTGGGIAPFASTQIVSESSGNNYIELNGGSTSTTALYFGDSADQDVGGVLYNHSNNSMSFRANAASRMAIDSSGNVGIGTTTAATSLGSSTSSSDTGVSMAANGRIAIANNNSYPLALNRYTSEGALINFLEAGVSRGTLGIKSNEIYIADGTAGLRMSGTGTNNVIPCSSSGVGTDNATDLGGSSNRFDDVYATNGTIQTSDRNEKQDIAELSDAEQRVAVAAKGLLRKFRWKDSVTEKGDDARIHFGIIAQDLQAAFAAEGLDAGDYAMFISTTWWEQDVEVPAVEAVEAVYETQTDEEGNETQVLISEAIESVDAYTETHNYSTIEEAPEGATEKTRLGVRYSELLAFIISAL